MNDDRPAIATRDEAVERDRTNPLAGWRDRFAGLPDDLQYLVGNSLGPVPRVTAERLARFTTDEWGGRIVRGWPRWIEAPSDVGDLLGGALVGAAPGQVVVGDSTSVELYKLVSAALDARPAARAIAVAADEFPTDRYVVEGLAAARELAVRVVPTDGLDGPVGAAAVADACADGTVAVVVASLVRYRTGALADLAGVTAAAQDHGALVCWDLSHAVGAVPIALDAAGVDLAVGCTYKYLNSGPGAPALAYRAARHAALRQPIWGWFGQQQQFAMDRPYDPYTDARQLLCGTPPIAGLVAVQEGARLHVEAGIEVVRAVSLEQTDLLMQRADEVLAPHGVTVATPREAERRGSHVALRHPDAWPLGQALGDRGVIVDHRPPDIIRLASAPLHTRFVDIWDAVDALADILASGAHRAYPSTPAPVT